MSFKSIANWKTLLIAALVSTLVACSGGSGSSSTSTDPIYTAIFDAGSSGTRLSLFKVIPGNGGYPSISLLSKYNDKVDGVPDDDGINDFLNGKGFIILKGDSLPAGCPGTQGLGPTAVNPCVIQPLLQQLDQTVAKLGLAKSQVKVELFATAGMRTEEVYNGGANSADTINQFYASMKTYVSNWGYNAGQFKTINGNSEEGVWTWINLNDQYFNAFGGNTTYWTQAPTTRGNFEVGGSSMQIAFPTSQISPSPDNNVYTVTINKHTYNVFSKTYLGLGGDDARKFMRSYGYNTVPAGSNVPGYNYGIDCFGTGATATNTTEPGGVRLFYNSSFYPNSGTITTNAVNNEWTPLIDPLSTNPLLTYPLKWPSNYSGAFNSGTCTTKYNAITTAVMSLPRNNFGTTAAQQVVNNKTASYSEFAAKVALSSADFIGVDGFWWAPNFLEITNASNPVSLYTKDTYQTAYANKCNSSYAGGTKSNIQSQRSCADATYMNDFLWRSGGLFSSSAGPQFVGSAPNDYKGAEVLTWTRGYLLQQYAN
jgi:hypothetical protein